MRIRFVCVYGCGAVLSAQSYLQLVRCKQLQEGRVNDDEGLVARNGKRVGVWHWMLSYI